MSSQVWHKIVFGSNYSSKKIDKKFIFYFVINTENMIFIPWSFHEWWHDHHHVSPWSWYDHGNIMAWQSCFSNPWLLYLIRSVLCYLYLHLNVLAAQLCNGSAIFWRNLCLLTLIYWLKVQPYCSVLFRPLNNRLRSPADFVKPGRALKQSPYFKNRRNGCENGEILERNCSNDQKIGLDSVSPNDRKFKPEEIAFSITI